MMDVAQEESGGVVGVYHPQAHVASVHAGNDHAVGLEGSPGVAHGHDLDVPKEKNLAYILS